MANIADKTLALSHNEYEQLKITDADNHVFFMEMGKAIACCRRLREWEVDREHDDVELADLVNRWMKENRVHFFDITVKPTERGLTLYFCPNTEEFSIVLSEKLAALESDAIKKLTTLRLDTRQVSKAELEELRELERGRRHAEHHTSHQPVEA